MLKLQDIAWKMVTDPSSSTAVNGETANAHSSVLVQSEALPADAVHVRGPDLSRPIDLHTLLAGYETIGFQATGLARATQLVEEMVKSDFLTKEVTDIAEKAQKRSGRAIDLVSRLHIEPHLIWSPGNTTILGAAQAC